MSDGRDDIDEGYVKYVSHWITGPAPDQQLVDRLNRWRRPLFDAGLIGHYAEHDVGFGNISVRSADGLFVISGTRTGHVADLTAAHYALVTAADAAANRVECVGPIQASSEALTHAALYALDDSIDAVVHVHSNHLWRRWRDRLPTTSATVPYGTPAMAAEFERLWRETDFRRDGIAVMAGHDEGIVSCGETLAIAAGRILDLARRESGG